MSTSDFSSAIDRAPGARSKSDEKSEVLIGVVEIMLTVNYSHSGDSATLIGNFTPRHTQTKPTHMHYTPGVSWMCTAKREQSTNIRRESDPRQGALECTHCSLPAHIYISVPVADTNCA